MVIQAVAATVSILKNKKVGLFRADSGFCSETIMKFIEDKKIAYVMSCKLYARLQSVIYGIKNWQAMGMGIWIAEIEFKQGN